MHVTVANRDSDSHGNSYSYCDGDSYCNGNCYGDAAAYSNAASTSDAKASAITVTRTIRAGTREKHSRVLRLYMGCLLERARWDRIVKRRNISVAERPPCNRWENVIAKGALQATRAK